MRVTALVENIPLTDSFASTHGLSYYIEPRSAAEHKVLFDLGSNHLFIDTAHQLGINIASVDTVVISHGHRDHGGGLRNFFSQNRKATVYLRDIAFRPYYVLLGDTPRFVGLDQRYQEHPQVELITEDTSLGEHMILFTDVGGCELLSHSNCVLREKKEGDFLQDMFDHEQNLIYHTDTLRVLFCGCAHNGIINILERAEKIAGAPMTHVVGGFHLYNSFEGTTEAPALVRDIAKQLAARNTQYYTGHCTGKAAYALLREELGEQIEYFYAGQQIMLHPLK